MSKVTSKLQVTIPKLIADRYGIQPGDEIDWAEAGDSIRVLTGGDRAEAPGAPERRVELFDAATARQHERQAGDARERDPAGRGWSREELYVRGRTD